MKIAAKAASSCSNHSPATNHGCSHNSRLSTCTTDDKLIAALGTSYVHPTYESVSAPHFNVNQCL